MTPEVLNRLSASVQPLIFETGVPATPYSTAGTSFLVGHRGRAFVVTARHSLHPENLAPICVFPSDSSQRLLPLKDVFFVSRDDVDEDFVDLALIEIDMPNAMNSELGQATLVDLALASGEWLTRGHAAELFVIGYPEEHSFVDYDQELLVNARFALHARYVGPSCVRHLHETQVVNTHSLSTFNGFSGAPVFAYFEYPDGRAEVVFCGMALRATSSSRRLHFLDRSILIDALNVKLRLTRAASRK